jgi:hypothetical protein
MSLLSKLEILAYKPKIYTNGKESYSTRFGILISTIVLTAVSLLSVYFTVDFFMRTKATIINELDTNFEKNIDLNEFPLLFKLCNSVGKVFNTSITYPIATHWEFFPEKNGVPVITTLKHENCNINKHFGNKSELFSDFQGLDTYSCVSTGGKNLSLSGTYGDITKGYAYILIYLARCVNNSEYNPGVTCAPQSEIDATLASLNPYMYTVTLDSMINHQNVTHPMQQKTRVDQLLFPPQVLYRHDLNMKKIKYNSDEGLVMEEQKTYESFGFQSAESYIYLGSRFRLPEAYGINLVKLFDKQEIFHRYYPKLQVLAANIGGIMKFIVTIGSVLVNHISSQYYLFDLLDKFMHIHDDDEIKISKVNSYNNFENVMKSQTSNNAIVIKKTSSKRKKFAFKDAILIDKCVSSNSPKHLISQYASIFRNQFSVEYLIKLIIDFEKLKNVFFDESQMKLFNRIRNPTISESKKRIESVYKHLDINLFEFKDKEIDGILGKLANERLTSSPDLIKSFITKSLVKECNK